MCEIDLEPCEVWRETERTARKPHRCNTCGAEVRPGQRYVDHFSVFEGEANREVSCPPCDVDRRVFAREHDGMLVAPSYFEQALLDCLGDGDPETEATWRPMLAALRARKPRVVG